MKRFFVRISEKARNVKLAPITMVALGDSVTQGVMEHRILDGEGVYHRLLHQELEAFFLGTSFSTINAGVSGGSAPEAVERLERDVFRYDPHLVLVAFGLNDSLGGVDGLVKFQIALETIVRQVRQRTGAEIIMLTPPFMARCGNSRVHWEHDAVADSIIRAQNGGSLAKYADMIRTVAAEQGVLLVDIHREWERLCEDGLDTDVLLKNGLNHPDRRGHKLISQLIFSGILSSRSSI